MIDTVLVPFDGTEHAESAVEYVGAVFPDQIVIGSHGQSGLHRVLVGSVAEHVARSVSVPTTIV